VTDEQQQILGVYLLEYEKLKDEQTERIGFRDNLLYFTLGIYGAVLALALGEQESPIASYALLVLPWVSLILGWTYLINDQKITAIGQYVRYNLAEKISELTGKAGEGVEAVESIFGWEIYHRGDKCRKRRKIEQWIIDEIAFVLSGIFALGAFWYQMSSETLLLDGIQVLRAVRFLSLIEFVLLVVLGIEMFLYADLDKGR